MNIHERIDDQVELAKSYAEDGAFRSAARVLRQIAREVENHADACDSEFRQIISDPR